MKNRHFILVLSVAIASTLFAGNPIKNAPVSREAAPPTDKKSIELEKVQILDRLYQKVDELNKTKEFIALQASVMNLKFVTAQSILATFAPPARQKAAKVALINAQKSIFLSILVQKPIKGKVTPEIKAQNDAILLSNGLVTADINRMIALESITAAEGLNAEEDKLSKFQELEETLKQVKDINGALSEIQVQNIQAALRDFTSAMTTRLSTLTNKKDIVALQSQLDYNWLDIRDFYREVPTGRFDKSNVFEATLLPSGKNMADTIEDSIRAIFKKIDDAAELKYITKFNVAYKNSLLFQSGHATAKFVADYNAAIKSPAVKK